jgi:predicted transcriptional regulator
VKHELVQIALRKSHGNQSEAARMLGVTPQAVNKFLRTARPQRQRKSAASSAPSSSAQRVA